MNFFYSRDLALIYERVKFLHNKTRHNRISEYIIDDESPVLNAHNAWFSHYHVGKSGTQIWSNLVRNENALSIIWTLYVFMIIMIGNRSSAWNPGQKTEN